MTSDIKKKDTHMLTLGTHLLFSFSEGGALNLPFPFLKRTCCNWQQHGTAGFIKLFQSRNDPNTETTNNFNIILA